MAKITEATREAGVIRFGYSDGTTSKVTHRELIVLEEKDFPPAYFLPIEGVGYAIGLPDYDSDSNDFSHFAYVQSEQVPGIDILAIWEPKPEDLLSNNWSATGIFVEDPKLIIDAE